MPAAPSKKSSRTPTKSKRAVPSDTGAAATKRKAASSRAAQTASQDVASLMATLKHPHKDAIERLRALIQSADERIVESVKWNAPSFATDEHFATFHLRAKKGVVLVMHFGAKKRDDLPKRSAISDPTGLLTWLADDRATITFDDLADVEAKQKPLVEVVRAWVRAMPNTR